MGWIRCAQDRIGDEVRDRPRGRVEDGVAHVPAQSRVRPIADKQGHDERSGSPRSPRGSMRATASVCRARVRSPNVPATRGTVTGRARSGAGVDDGSPPPCAGGRRRRRARNGTCGGARASTAAATASQTTRFHTSVAGKPTSRVFRSAAVQYRVISCSVPIPSGSASADSIGLSIWLRVIEGDHVADEEADRAEVHRDHLPGEHRRS